MTTIAELQQAEAEARERVRQWQIATEIDADLDAYKSAIEQRVKAEVGELANELLHRWVTTDASMGRETLEMETWRAIAPWIKDKIDAK